MPELTDTVAGMLTPTPKGIVYEDPYDLRDDGAYDHWLRSRGGGGYGSYNGSKTPMTGTSYSYTTRKIEVVGDDGTIDRWNMPYDSKEWWDIAKTVWPLRIDKDADVLTIPVAHCKFSFGEPKFNACVYTGTNDYLQARWGRKLDDSDRRWLAAHPLATDGGIPQEYTATCIDQLVAPYGMRVSRVRIRKGALVLGDSIMGWLKALGCNPMAMADRATSNADAATLLGLPLDQANALWRVEFHDDPLPCSIVGERGWSSGSGVSVGNYGGHCRYLAPRSAPGDWFISVQLDMDTAVSHLVPPPNPEYVPRKGEPTLLYTDITGPDHTLVAIKVNGKWTPSAGGPVQPAAAPAELPATTTPALWTDEQEQQWLDRQRSTTEVASVCCLCGNPTLIDETVLYADVCADCIAEAWQGYSCPHCEEQFLDTNLPIPNDTDGTKTHWSCTTCSGTITVTVGGDRYLDELNTAIFLPADDMPRSLEDTQ